MQDKHINMPWKTVIKRFVVSAKGITEFGNVCAYRALVHYAEHGDFERINEFMAALNEHGEKASRPAAFVKYVESYTELRCNLEAKKFELPGHLKGKSAHKETNLQAARATPMWSHSRNTEGLQFYTDEKVIDSLVGSIKRFKNEKRFEPATGKAAFALVTLENAINKARAEILDYVDPEPTEENANDTASATV